MYCSGGLARYAGGGMTRVPKTGIDEATRRQAEYLVNALGSGPLSRMPHSELDIMRRAANADQELLAPLEHRAFAREWTREQPLLAIPSLIGAIPGYTAGKALGLIKARSPASLAELLAGYRGLGEGVMSLFRE